MRTPKGTNLARSHGCRGMHLQCHCPLACQRSGYQALHTTRLFEDRPRRSQGSCIQSNMSKIHSRGISLQRLNKTTMFVQAECIAWLKCNTASKESKHYVVVASLTIVRKRRSDRFARSSHTAGAFLFSFSSSSASFFSPSISSLARASAVSGTPVVPVTTRAPAAARGLSS